MSDFDIQGFTAYVLALGHADALIDRDRQMPGVYFRGPRCSVAVFCPGADGVGAGFVPNAISFSEECGAPATHFFAREAALAAIGMEEKVIVGRTVFWAQGLAALLDHAPDDLIGASFGVGAIDRVTFKPTRRRTLCLHGRTWYAAAAPTEWDPADTAKSLVLRPMSLLTEVVRHVA